MASATGTRSSLTAAPTRSRKQPTARKPKPVGHLVGYARVSTAEQDPALQLDALTAAWGAPDHRLDNIGAGRG